MRADYDRTANAISIAISDAPHADSADEVHSRAIVALAAGKPVEAQLLYPELGIKQLLAAVVDRYELDLEALAAAAHPPWRPPTASSCSRSKRDRRPEPRDPAPERQRPPALPTAAAEPPISSTAKASARLSIRSPKTEIV